MATSKVVQWRGGSRSAQGNTTKFIVKQSDRPFGSVPKTEYAFQQYLLENGYYSTDPNSAQATASYDRLRSAFWGPCGGGDGTLMFGLEVVRFDRSIGPDDYKLRPSYGGVTPNGVKSNVVKQLNIDVTLQDKIVIDDYYIQDVVHPTSVVQVSPGFYMVGSKRTSLNPGTWSNYIYDEDGNIITGYNVKHPTYEIVNGILTLNFPKRQVGTYTINIEHEYDSWTLTLVPRRSAIDIFDPQEVYDCTVIAFAAKQFYSKPIEIPDEAVDCIPYGTVVDPDTGVITTVIKPPSDALGWDLDGDGKPDGGAYAEDGEDICTCWQCGGSGKLPGCVEENDVDCTCNVCGGSGELPGCQDQYTDDWGERYDYDYYRKGGDGGDGSDSRSPYKLKVKVDKCDASIVDWEVVKK